MQWVWVVLCVLCVSVLSGSVFVCVSECVVCVCVVCVWCVCVCGVRVWVCVCVVCAVGVVCV